MGGQTHLSVDRGEKPGKLGCACVLLSWLCEQIRKEAQGELLILGLFHTPPFSWSAFLCAAAGLGVDLH